MTEEQTYEHDADVRRSRTRRAVIRAQAGLTLLLGLVALLVLTALGALVYQTVVIRDNQARTRQLVEVQQQQQRDVKAILARNARNDTDRAAVIDAAVAKIAAAQRKALFEHDARVEALLRRNLALTNAEVNATGNQEQRSARPAPMQASTPANAVAPAPTATTPRTAAPAQRPPPCEKAGKSGRCKK